MAVLPSPVARVILAGAALLASATAQPLRAQTASDDVALAIPRLAPRGRVEVALPQPLPPDQAEVLRRVFSLQGRGDIAGAGRDTKRVATDTPLGKAMVGHVLADRYLGPFTRPGPAPLQDWLASWGDLPDAPAIHALLIARLPRGAKAPPAPKLPAMATGSTKAVPVPEETEPAGLDVDRRAALDRAVHAEARAGRPEAALRLIAQAAHLSPGYGALLAGETARILFTQNRDEEALEAGRAGMRGCGHAAGCQEAALPGYVAGLAALRLGRPEIAAPLFETAWRAGLTTSALRAGSAYWAAMAHLRVRDYPAYLPWMRRAAAEQSSFYGQIARRRIGLAAGGYEGGEEVLTEADIDAVSATAPGLRAFALLQIGQPARAEAELRLLWPEAQAKPALARAVMLVAARAGLVELAARLADAAEAADGQPRDAMRFSVPRLHPRNGFTIDPAMVYALARTESNFDAALVSSAGARGLMQIMPDTAQFIRAATGGSGGGIFDPEVNLDLGQFYVSYLAEQQGVNGDLLRLLASYNCGPAGIARWAPEMRDQNDPLLFIEAIPVDETRGFVQRVLDYTWLYAARLHLPTPSLDELAAGQWPRYHQWPPAQVETAQLH
jgi:soluble lytic murein transglycosylase-like protein